MNKAQTGIVVVLLLVLLIALTAFERVGAGVFGEETQNGAAAVMWLERHELTMRPGEDKAVLDGAVIEGEPLLVNRGRSYVAIKMVERAGAGQVFWDNTRRQAVIEMKDSIHGALDQLYYEAGTPYPYSEDGTALTDLRMPPPFLYQGRMYIPVSVLPAQGIAAEWADGAVTWRWSDKRVRLAADTVVASGPNYSLTVLYQQELMTPQLLLAGGGGRWSGLEGQVVERGIVQGDRLFNRIAFRTKLQPGPNPIELRSASTRGQTMEVYWEASNQEAAIPVKLYAEGEERVEITAPLTGYSRVQAGDNLTIEGRIRHTEPAEGDVTLAVYRFNRDAYDYSDHVQDLVVPVTDGSFAGDVSLEAGGDYLIQIISPRYLELPGQKERGVALWAELRVVAEQE
ncbi:stalk domain-containing protein [Paenibacillus daejeonensis]|uniref:stalk domain-containing protein n=1 Tax=Paenibacillus daejeonensis TaxID=135193 RepID=UPI0003785E92|nr:stalk domain-containing protein [Paenibacillus daejeonensis]